MKKLIAIMLALLMLTAVLTACADNKTPVDGTTKAPSDGTTAAPAGSDTTAKQEAVTTKKPDSTTKPTTTAPVTTAAPEIPMPELKEGLMVYYENFDSYSNTADTAATMALLGWTVRNISDGALTDNTGTYTIEDGALKAINHNGGAVDGKDSYTLILEDKYMKPVCQGDYTLQYDIKYTDAVKSDRYIVIVLNYDGYNSYNSFHLRFRGSANNQPRFIGSWYAYDVAGDYYSADTNDADGTSTVLKKLCGIDYVESEFALRDKWITVKYQASYNEGPTVWLRDNSQANAEFVCVSKADSTGSGYLYWNMIEAYGVALKLGGKIDGFVDNIAIYTGLGDLPSDTTTTEYNAAIADYLAKVK